MSASPARKLGIAALIVGALLAIFGAFYAVLVRTVALALLRPPKKNEYESQILAIDNKAKTITLSRSVESEISGKYGLFFDDDQGYLRFADIIKQDSSSITRKLDEVVFGEPLAGMKARVMSWYYLTPAELGLKFSEIELPSDVGPLPCWVFPASDSKKWVVLVHGRAVNRAECLRAVPLYHQLGYNCLVLSYRNDGVAPESIDGYYSLGLNEWEDLETAVSYAKDSGAEHLVIAAWSMGGAISLQFLLNSGLSAEVNGLVLDSPVIDWRSVLAYQADAANVPELVQNSTITAMASEYGRFLIGNYEPIDLDEISALPNAEDFDTPILILHSDDDGYVPADPSREFAALRPDIVTLVSFDTARHVRLWNYDEKRWTNSVKTWVSSL